MRRGGVEGMRILPERGEGKMRGRWWWGWGIGVEMGGRWGKLHGFSFIYGGILF